MLVALFQIDITSLNRFAGDEDEDVGNKCVANKIFFLSLLWIGTILLTIVISIITISTTFHSSVDLDHGNLKIVS